MNITVLTPDRELFHGSITSVKVPGVKGKFQVLENHAPIVSSLLSGMVTLVTDAGEYTYWDAAAGTKATGNEAGRSISYEIDSGFIEVLNNEISLLVQGVTQ
jgi:F-type H+-transporting ATPase subunit epsilon